MATQTPPTPPSSRARPKMTIYGGGPPPKKRKRRWVRVALWTFGSIFLVLVAFTVVDLLAANASVNPTIPAAWMEAPAWTRQVDRGAHQRVYIGGRLFGEIDARDVDAPKYAAGFDRLTDMERRYVTVNELMFHTSGSQIRRDCPQ